MSKKKLPQREILAIVIWLCSSCGVSMKIGSEEPETNTESNAIDPLTDAANPSHPILRWRKEQILTQQKAVWAVQSKRAQAANSKISTGSSFSCATNLKKELKCWGFSANGATGKDPSGADSTDYFEAYTGIVQKFATDDSHSCVLSSSSKLTCHGYNYYGQLGNGITDSSFKPISPIGLESDIIWVGVKSSQTCSINRRGELKCWGSGFSKIPIKPFGSNDPVISLALGSGHSCLQDADFSARCWGNNSKGQLGVAEVAGSSRTAPIKVDGLSDGVIQIAVGTEHSCALIATGGVKCWGGNSKGQLGNGTTDDQKSPVDVSGLQSDVVSIALGDEFSCALMINGGLKCWGLNGSGQLGDGTTENRTTPVDVVGLPTTIENFSAGPNFVCSVDKDSNAWCWGSSRGPLVNGALKDSSVPVKLSGFN